MRKMLVICTTAIIAASALGMTVSTMAENTEAVSAEKAVLVNTSFGNGIITAKIPENEVWKEVVNDDACVTITDGVNTILFNHYSSPGELPTVASYDSQHEMTYEVAYSKADISVTLVGKIAHTSDYSEVRKIIDSINIDTSKLDEAHTAQKHQTKTDSYSVNEVNYNAWVTSPDGLCVRDAGSTEGAYLTTAEYGEKLTVIGEVMKNGVDTGWRKVKTADGIVGYSNGQFLTTNEIKPDEKKEQKHEEGDDFDFPQSVAIYCAGDLRYVYRCADGRYCDSQGKMYDALSNFTTFISEDGITYYSADSQGIDPADWDVKEALPDARIYISSEEGDERYLTNGGSDVYFDNYGIEYTHLSEGVWKSAEGIIYYEI